MEPIAIIKEQVWELHLVLTGEEKDPADSEAYRRGSKFLQQLGPRTELTPEEAKEAREIIVLGVKELKTMDDLNPYGYEMETTRVYMDGEQYLEQA